MLCVTGCTKDEPGDPETPSNSVPDPEGTVLVSMRNGNNGGTAVYPVSGNTGFLIDAEDNFQGRFVSLGAMKGLGNVTKIPTTGWAAKVKVVPGYGYVGASLGSGVTYFRIYVTDWITDAIYDGVIGADVKYQSPFVVTSDAKELTLSETVVNLSSHYDRPTITISPFNANWSVSASATNSTYRDWCGTWASDINSFTIQANVVGMGPDTATVTVKVEGLPEKTITVTYPGY